MGIYDRLGVPKVINAAGKLTALGGSVLTEDVVEAMNEAARAHVDLSALRLAAGRAIAEAVGAEAACVTAGAAAGIAVAVGACICGEDQAAVWRLPLTDGRPNEVLLQAGHWVNFGAPVEQMVRMAGGVPVPVGWANSVPEDLLRESMGGRTACFLFVQSHHAVQKGMLPLERCIAVCGEYGVPVVVDAAAEEDPHRYLEMGADLVVYSGAKAFEGPTTGFVAGWGHLIRACELQHTGIARTMKVGKEDIAGLVVALDAYVARRRGEGAEDGVEATRRHALTELLHARLKDLPHTAVTVAMDDAGRDIPRVALTPDAAALGFTARELVKALAAGNPSIRTRNHYLSMGTILLDPRAITEVDAGLIVDRIGALYTLLGR